VFRHGDVGYGSAMAVVLTVTVVALGLLFVRFQRARIEPVQP
jgi:ABC-type sugar transport system permease subunit